MREPIKISLVVTNYNYGRYLPQCLDSVRAQTYPHVECIVVDDGSTDDSRSVIAAYPEMRAILQANTGHAIAAKNGFKAATGDVVVFLDSDDFLMPDACAEIARLWTPDLVSLHYRLQIYQDGAFVNRFWPEDTFRTGAEQIDCLFRFGYVPAAPTSGNAYARSYLDMMFRKASGLHFNSIDACLAYSAPVVGNTAHSERALGAYRIHNANLSSWTARRAVSGLKMGLFYNYHAQATARRLAAERNLPVPRWDFLNGPYDLKLYLLTRGISIAKTDLPPRSALACATQSARTFLAMRGLPLVRKLANVAIVYFLAAAPHAWRRLIGERFYNLDFAK